MADVSSIVFAQANDRYLPDFSEILSALPELENPDGSVRVPVRFVRFLLSQLAECLPIDEDLYATDNPDIASAFKSGQVVSRKLHFAYSGYFEHRRLPAAISYEGLQSVRWTIELDELGKAVGQGWTDRKAG